MLYERLWPAAHLTLRIALVRALGELAEKNDRFRGWLTELLTHEDPFVRANAVTALSCAKLPVIEKVIGALKDQHELVVRAAQEALAALAPNAPAVVSFTLKALEDANAREPHAPVPVSLLPDPLPLQQGAAGQLTLAINAAQLEDVPVTVTNVTPAVLQVPAQIVVPAGAASFRIAGKVVGVYRKL